jgi:hypothetical protein
MLRCSININIDIYTWRIKMTISSFMLNILERLAEIFPKDGYQSRLETYLSTKSITDAATLDNYIKEFTYNSHKENFK